MPGVTPITYAHRLIVAQSAQETTWGTAIPLATARWMGLAPNGQFKPYVKSVLYDEERGNLAWSFNSNVLQLGGEYQLNWAYASYEDILYGLYNVLKAVTPTGAGPFVYTFAGPLTSINPLMSYTLEYGYDIATGQYAGCIGKKLTIKGEMKKQWEAQLEGFYKTYLPNNVVNIQSSTNASPIQITTATNHGYANGQQVVITGHLVNTAANGTWTIAGVTANTFTLTGSTGNGIGAATGTVARIQTPAIADRVVEAILFPGTVLSIDAAGGAPGTTPFPNCFLSFQLDIENNVQPIWTGDSKNPATYAYDRLKPTLALKMLENAQVKALVDNTLMAGSRVVVDIKQTSGTKVAEIQFAGVLADDPARYGNESGAVMLEVKLEGQVDNGSLANQLQVIMTNSVSALP